MKQYFKENYGFYVCSDKIFDYWNINGFLYPTSYKFLDKEVGYRFEIDNDFAYPSLYGFMSKKQVDYFLKKDF